MSTLTTSKNFKTLAKMGYLSRGVIYLVIGGMALLAAFSGKGDKSVDDKEALVTIMHQPFGQLLLALLIIGLAGFVLWRFTQAVKDTDSHGKSAKGAAIRIGLLISGIAHALLALWALRLLLSDGGSSSQGEGYLGSTAGQWLIALAGAGVIGAGLAHIVKGWNARFERYMTIPADKKAWAKPVCRVGLIARGLVWCIIGWFLIYTAFIAQDRAISGIGDALNFLQNQNYGNVLFSLVAAGLFCFGVYNVLEALYRRIA